MTSLSEGDAPLARRATDLLAAERSPSIPAPSRQQRDRSIGAIAAAIALEGRARRRRRFVMGTAIAAAASFVLLASALLVRASAPAATVRDHGLVAAVVAPAGTEAQALARTLAGRPQP